MPVTADPWADKDETEAEYKVKLEKISDIKDADCVILAVAHDEFKKLSLSDIDGLYKDVPNGKKVLVDVKSILNKEEAENAGYRYWRL